MLLCSGRPRDDVLASVRTAQEPRRGSDTIVLEDAIKSIRSEVTGVTIAACASRSRRDVDPRRPRTAPMIAATAVVLACGGLAVAMLAQARGSDVATSDPAVVPADDTTSRSQANSSIAPPASTGATRVAGSEVTTVPRGRLLANGAREFELGGTLVVTRTQGDQLPAVAESIQLTTAVIMVGSGPPVACTGMVEESIPPSCNGFSLTGLDEALLDRSDSNTTWSNLALALEPSASDAAVVAAATRTSASPWTYRAPHPPECPVTENGVGDGALGDHAAAHPNSVANIYLSDLRVWVIEVLADADSHRQQLADRGVVAPCVVEVSADVRSRHDEVASALASAMSSSNYGAIRHGEGGRVDVEVIVADVQTVRAIQAAVEDPATIRVVGLAEIGS